MKNQFVTTSVELGELSKYLKERGWDMQTITYGRGYSSETVTLRLDRRDSNNPAISPSGEDS